MPKKVSEKRRWVEEYPDIEGAVLLDGLDDAIVGVVSRLWGDPCVAYDEEKILEAMVKGGMTMEEAIEFFDYKVAGAWMGERTPFILRKVGSHGV
jgi:hypothetical protein